MHDPFAMRPFFGYNAGDYLAHWLSMEKPDRKLPKIFHVNWFRRGQQVTAHTQFLQKCLQHPGIPGNFKRIHLTIKLLLRILY